MPYYPSSQVKINLYTKGGEFVRKIDNTPYTGFYWETSSKKYFSGKNPQEPNSTEIIRNTTITEDSIFTNPDVSNTVVGTLIETTIESSFLPTSYPKYDSTLSRTIPMYVPPFIVKKDYQQGYITRYFCKKTNEFLYLEINEDIYNKLINKDSKILYQLYKPFKLKWQISGDKGKVFNVNKNIIDLIIRDQKMYNFNQYLKENYTQFWKPIFTNLTEDLYTSGEDFKTEDGQDYVGYYHYHPVKGFMMGATHTSTPHNYIFYKKSLDIIPVVNTPSSKVKPSNKTSNSGGTPSGGMVGGGMSSGGGGY